MSFKVICINASDGCWGLASKMLKEGNVYTVIGDTFKPGGYILKEVTHPNEPFTAWKSTLFIPLSEIDETEYALASIESL